MAKQISENPYINFLYALQKFESNSGAALDLVSERLLCYISVQHSCGLTLTVTECMRLSSVASPATVHRKITELLNAGWIQTVYDGENKRNKYLAPTQRANRHFLKISKLLIQSIG